ncbi:MAG TPA: type I phosphomannose isomerase catalytic subunit [Gemmataceae bacterium]|nr:type I phosphomannose isomerase catalytic subunit [Gemmataceae bacterium]
METPLRFVPFLRPMVWGGRRLAAALDKPLPTAEPYGESWEVSDHPLHRSVVASGPLAGRTLRHLLETAPRALLGSAAGATATFPWLIKFLDANDWLSVQVHPDEPAVRWLWPQEGSKTEAWFILDAAPGSRVYAGLRPGVGPAQLLAAVKAGTVTECLHSFEPRPGDCLFLQAGTVHAVGGGVLMAEVQQTSDATYRLFDWDRKDAKGKSRELHLAESLACIDWQRGPVAPVHAEGFGEPRRRRQALVNCPYFSLELAQETEPFACGGTGRLQAAVVLAGRGRWAAGEELLAGQTWVLPAAMPAIECRPEGTVALLLATLP